MSMNKMKWGDDDIETDDRQKETVTSIDAKGIKTIVSYETDPKTGNEIKVTRRVKTVKRFVKVNKNVEARKKWKKFGKCQGLAPGQEKNITYESYEAFTMDMRPKNRDDMNQESSLDKLREKKESAANSTSIVVCRHCGETGHWTLKCPKRDSIVPAGGDDMPSSGHGGPSGGSTGGKYVPMHLRKDAKKFADRGRDESNTVRVTNLSEETSEMDLAELFRPFGHTTRIYLAKDRQTQVSRGFAFVTYVDRQSGQRAIDKLNGYGFDNLILHCEWAKPREDRTEGENTKAVLAKMRRQF